MSHQLNKHDATFAYITIPGVGIMLAIAATTTEAGTVGYGPGCLLLTTTSKVAYVNTGTVATATWTSQT